MNPRAVWTDTENVGSIGIRSPDRPARNESLYRLIAPGPHVREYKMYISIEFKADRWQ